MDIYLDANATTPVLPQAQAAALALMAQDFGNPSSIHSTGLRARAHLDATRATARRVLGAPSGRLLFLSGATEGIQTAVVSALNALRGRRDVNWLLYGATEHKAVPEALQHWNRLLGLGLHVMAIPVGTDGRHDLTWLREHAPRAGLVCTMAANNETGVISDLDGIAAALAGSPALWMVDSVQALGKLDLKLAQRPIDYAPFSGHKLYAPKGIGLLYVREGAPFTPLMAGGGQENAQRAGTENMTGIAALGAVLAALEDGESFRDAQTLAAFRHQLASALQEAFADLVFNAPPALCLPTTLNFSVPGLSAKLLQDLLDAAGIRVSGGSACSAALAAPSHVLQAMGLPDWQAASALRLSFGPAADQAFIDQACARIRGCGQALRAHGLSPSPQRPDEHLPVLTRFSVDGVCSYLLADAASRRCVLIDPLPALRDRLAALVQRQDYSVCAVLCTHSHGQTRACAQALRSVLGNHLPGPMRHGALDPWGWPLGAASIPLGALQLQRLAVPGDTDGACAYLLRDATGAARWAWLGDAWMPGTAHPSAPAAPSTLAAQPAWLQLLAHALAPRTLLLPRHDPTECHAYAWDQVQASLQSATAQGIGTLHTGADAVSETPAELTGAALQQLLRTQPHLRWVDVREPYEQAFSAEPALAATDRLQRVPLSALINALPDWLDRAAETPLLFFCRSGKRSAQAALALRRLGHTQAWSLAGGLALWPRLADSAELQATAA